MRPRLSPIAPLALLVVAACGSELPEPPDTSELEAAYVTPTATLTEGDQLGGLIEAVATLNETLGRADAIADGTTEAVPDPDDPEEDDRAPLPFDIRGAGVATLTHVCPGWPEHDERVADVTGVLETSVRFDVDGFDAVFWGEADRCAFVIDDRLIRIDAELIIARVDRGVLLSFDGDLEADGETIESTAFDFLVHRGGVDYRRELEGRGHVLVTIGIDGRATVRAANGAFACAADGCEPVEVSP